MTASRKLDQTLKSVWSREIVDSVRDQSRAINRMMTARNWRVPVHTPGGGTASVLVDADGRLVGLPDDFAERTGGGPPPKPRGPAKHPKTKHLNQRAKRRYSRKPSYRQRQASARQSIAIREGGAGRTAPRGARPPR